MVKCTIEEFHDVQLNLLKELKRICDQNGIPYYLACGTCLGAVRHKGFIPWDYDADVYMYIDDILRLKAVSDQLSAGYFFQDRHTDPQFNYPIFRIRDSRTTYIIEPVKELDINHGFCIDIYPLYYYPKNALTAHRNIIASYVYRLLIANRPPRHHGGVIGKAGTFALKMVQGKLRENIINMIEKWLRSPKNTDYVLTYFGLDITPLKALKYRSKWFGKPVPAAFEDCTFNLPTYPKAYLHEKYGDFMKLPPKEQQKQDFKFVVCADVHKSYLEYKGIYY
ncbi:MAG: LicD family protein [Oscillospiraceae bacterium]|nr:LicD family protein [Oscillospiraceae bacterium]